MQKLRDRPFVCVTGEVSGTACTQRLMQDDTQGCLQAVQRGNTESSRVTLPSSPIFIAHAGRVIINHAIHGHGQ